MIRRFALLSVALHAALAVLLFERADPTRLFPAPALTVALSHLAGRGAPPPAPAQADTIAQPVPAQAPERGLSTATDAGQTAKARDNNTADAGDRQRRNHLQTMLRAAFEAQFVYPPLARRHGWQGRVRVALRIDADGRFSELRVLRSSGYAVLDRDAVQTLERIGLLSQAHPWMEGRPVHVELPVVYRLLES